MLPTSLRPLIRLTPTLAPVSHRAVLSVSGSEATKFLNGVVASTVPIPAKGPYFTCFLNAQGRVIADAMVYTKKNTKGQDGYLIEYDAGLTEPALLPFLKRYVLRAKVRIEDVSHQYQVWAAWGSEEQRKWEGDRSWNFASSGVIEPVWESSDPWPWGHEECMIQDRRAVGMGMRMLLPTGERPTQAKTHDIADSDAYKLHRIMHGVPEGIDDIPPSQAFPMESNLDVMGGLDFRKGCYVGQELTVRTYHTGLLRKRILPVEVDAPARSGWREPTESKSPPPPANSHIGAVRNPGSEGEGVMIRGKGKLLSTTQGVGLALLRLEHVEGVEKGTMTLKIESDEPKEEKGSQSWIVKPWWPIWWPKP